MRRTLCLINYVEKLSVNLSTIPSSTTLSAQTQKICFSRVISRVVSQSAMFHKTLEEKILLKIRLQLW